ncbi:hypothetical protein ACFU7D_13425 [Nocardioides sp. NPDC057577]|uniref:hypothetical protein n=1 Tax=Nocardioides sp. NPDC057577 TaxID=3346171 RepID=UPI00366F280F
MVPGSVTDWTVTVDDQRRLKRAVVRAQLATPGFWITLVAMPPILTGVYLWAWGTPIDHLSFDVELKLTVAATVALQVLLGVAGVQSVRSRVESDFPVGSTFTSWATKTGLGVRTPNRLAFYPWSRLTQVDQGSVVVRFRQGLGRFRLHVQASLLAGPEEVSKSLDFPVQLIGQGIARELAMRSGPSAEPARSGDSVVIDRALHQRLSRGWMREQMGWSRWAFPALAAFQCATNLIDGSYRPVIVWMLILLVYTVSGLRGGRGPISAMYPVGAIVVGSVGESVLIQGPWGSVAWHCGWLRQVRVTEHIVAYNVVPIRHRGGLASLDKRIVVIPRAFLDTPTPAVSAEV